MSTPTFAPPLTLSPAAAAEQQALAEQVAQAPWYEVYDFTNPQGLSQRYAFKRWEEAETTTKPGLIFIPGLAGSVRQSWPYLASLREQFAWVACLDVPSFGLNEHLPLTQATHALDGLHLWLNEVLPKHQSEGQGLVLGGISLGGLFSLFVLQRMPHLSWQGLIWLVPALASSTRAFSPLWVGKSLLSLALRQSHKYVTLPYGAEHITRNQALLANLHQMHASAVPNLKPKVNLGFLGSLLPLQLKAKRLVKHTAVPVFMASAGEDVITCTQSMHKAFGQLPANPLHQHVHLPQAYHDVLLEPELPELLASTQAWLAQLS
jgi:alpha-beta hydrolase superfamily lysophospholipase